jgi:hypothetical protein
VTEAARPKAIAPEVSIEARLEGIYAARERAIWDCLALSIGDFDLASLPDCAALPAIYDPHHLLDGEHDGDGWTTAHWAYDYFPAPAGGLQHRVHFVAGRFVAHGVPISLLPPPPAKAF